MANKIEIWLQQEVDKFIWGLFRGRSKREQIVWMAYVFCSFVPVLMCYEAAILIWWRILVVIAWLFLGIFLMQSNLALRRLNENMELQTLLSKHRIPNLHELDLQLQDAQVLYDVLSGKVPADAFIDIFVKSPLLSIQSKQDLCRRLEELNRILN